jgi:hypothetical protein
MSSVPNSVFKTALTLLALTALSSQAMAYDGTSSSRTKRTKRLPSQSQSTSNQSSGINWAKVKEKVHMMYWSTVTGPNFGGTGTASVSDQGAVIPLEMFHMLWTGYRLNNRDTIGMLNRFSHTFGTEQQAFSVLNPRAYWRRSGIINGRTVGMNSDVRVEFPTTQSSFNHGMMFGTQIIQNWTFKNVGRRWFLGLQTGEQVNFYNDPLRSGSPTKFGAWMSPSASFTLDNKWSIYAWGWFDAGVHSFQPLSAWNGNDGDYVRVGPMYSVSENFQVYPCVQFFPFAFAPSTSSVGLELSASL